jgi:CMP-N-acetylneuraminic acid synthetase
VQQLKDGTNEPIWDRFKVQNAIDCDELHKIMVSSDDTTADITNTITDFDKLFDKVDYIEKNKHN